ncbi:MAG: amino-acid N-acetyltransferase [Gammaproteobacteria bacterium]|nr:amino-acid N-acetyltransferase [Gammaproteobacteria bacterium]
MTDSTNTIDWFRHTAPYINSHRGTTVVVGLRRGATANPNFINVVHDLALMHSLGVRLVVIHEQNTFNSEPLTPVVVNTAVVEALEERTFIERMFSMGLPNSPLHNARLRVISGNFITARPVGVINGVDRSGRGLVRHVDVAGITHSLDGSAISLISPLGHSPAGEVFTLDALDVMGAVSRSLGADKLIVMSDFDGIEGSDGDMQRQLTVDVARQILESSDQAEKEALMLACDACDSGVPRSHLISYALDGGLLKELYTHDGIGTLISPDEYEQIKVAETHDLAGILELIRPLQQAGVLAERPNEEVERSLGKFTVITKDSRVIACAALLDNPADSIAEIASVATHTDYRDSGHGERLVAALIDAARQAELERVYVRTTQTGHWFQELGFTMSSSDALPESEKQKAKIDRNSNILVRAL